MYEELIKQLRELPHLLFVNLHGHEDVVYKAADAIEELSKPRWIPVTERLPENGYYVLAYEDGDIMMASYEGGNWVLRDLYEIIDDLKPTHWMPLPEPPKEE